MTCFAVVSGGLSANAIRAGEHAASQDGREGALPRANTDPSGTITLFPGDLYSLYGIPLDAGGIPVSADRDATIGVIDAYGDPSAESDMATLRSTFHLPACTTANGCLTKVNQAGSRQPLPSTNAAWISETSLDLAAISVLCPTCHILLVEANSNNGDDMSTAVQTAHSMGARYISMSFGADEEDSDAAEISALDARMDAADTVYVAATGDGGYAAGTPWPASAPNVIAVGGTTARPAANGGWQQTAWNQSGSGCSSLTPATAAQRLLPTIIGTCAGMRAVSDISAIADPHTNIPVVVDGEWRQAGGTSVAAPIIASLYALAGNHTDPGVIYRNQRNYPSLISDITSGFTTGCKDMVAGASRGPASDARICTGTPGWDGATGLGSPTSPQAMALHPVLKPSAPGRLTVRGKMKVRGARGSRVKTPRHGRKTVTLKVPSITSDTVAAPVTTTITWTLVKNVKTHGTPGQHRTARSRKVTDTVGSTKRLKVKHSWAGYRLRATITARAFGYATYTAAKTFKVR